MGTFLAHLQFLWETGIERLTGDSDIATSHTHPTFDSRLKSFADELAESHDENTPDWYPFVHNGIRIATQLMADQTLGNIKEKLIKGDILSARALPRSFQHLGLFNGWSAERYWISIADMLTSEKTSDRRLGLWFFVSRRPSVSAP